MYVYASVYVYVHEHVYACVCGCVLSSIERSVHSCICTSTCGLIDPSMHLSICIRIRRFIDRSMYLSIYQSVDRSICLSIRVYILLYLSICRSAHPWNNSLIVRSIDRSIDRFVYLPSAHILMYIEETFYIKTHLQVYMFVCALFSTYTYPCASYVYMYVHVMQCTHVM